MLDYEIFMFFFFVFFFVNEDFAGFSQILKSHLNHRQRLFVILGL